MNSICYNNQHNLTQEKTQMSIHPDLTTLEQVLKKHDWYFDYSDDHRVWERGRNEREEIRRQMDICCGLGLDTVANELYKKYSP